MKASVPLKPILTLALLLCSCGGGAESSPPPAAPAPAVVPAPAPPPAPTAAPSDTETPAPAPAPKADTAAPEPPPADAPAASDAQRSIKFIQTPEGLRVEVMGVKFVPKVEAVRTQLGFDVKVTVSATASESRSLLAPKGGPLAFAGVVKRAGKSEPEPFGDAREGDGDQPLGAGTTVKLSREWPGAIKVHSLGNGDVLELDVGLWGLGTSATDRRAVKQFLRVKAKVEEMESARVDRAAAEREGQMSMSSSRAIVVFACGVAACVVTACGGSKAPAEVAAPGGDSPASSAAPAASGASDADAEPKAAAGAGLPKECAKKGGTCVPPRGFVQKLCSGSFPSVALYLFANKSPWARGYLRGRTKAWNASGGASDNGWLEFDEEVLVLAERKADMGGMQVSGAGASYDALRWDGGCVTLSSEEVTLDKPPSPKSSKVEWRFLDDNVQEALRTNESVNKAYLVRRQECKGATSGDVSMKCVKADQKLSDEIVSYLRAGGSLPEPTKLP